MKLLFEKLGSMWRHFWDTFAWERTWGQHRTFRRLVRDWLLTADEQRLLRGPAPMDIESAKNRAANDERRLLKIEQAVNRLLAHTGCPRAGLDSLPGDNPLSKMLTKGVFEDDG